MTSSYQELSGKKPVQKPVHRQVASVDAPFKVKALDLLRDSIFAISAHGCWIWQGKVGRDGYGFIRVRLDGQSRVYSVHRLVFEFFKNKLGAGMMVRHACHTPLCLNFDHLVEGTARENSADMVNAGRAAWQRKNPVNVLVGVIGYGKLPRKMSPLAAQVMQNELARRK